VGSADICCSKYCSLNIPDVKCLYDGRVPDRVDFDDERLTLMGLFAESWSGIAARGAAQLAEHGLATVEFEVLLRLARSPMGLLRMSDLAAQTSVTTSGVTRVVDRLEDRGLVARQACETDRRTTYAVVTDAGRALLRAALPGHLALVDTWLLRPLREAAGGPDGVTVEGFEAALRRLRDSAAPCATAGSEGSPSARVAPAAS
jgi:DNA-binding MarR family transcriptional regulator